MKILETIKDISNIINFLKEDKKEDPNKKFNHQLNNEKDTSYCDSLRKQKQKVIEDLKND